MNKKSTHFRFDFSTLTSASLRRGAVCVFMVLSGAGVVGCVTALPAPEALEKIAKQRSEEFWRNVVEAKYSEAYAMLTDSSKEAVPLRRFAQQIASLRILGAQLEQVKCVENSCTAKQKLEVTMRVPKIAPQKVSLDHEDVWLLESGELRLVRK
jgi:uncharacterized protein YhdP